MGLVRDVERLERFCSDRVADIDASIRYKVERNRTSAQNNGCYSEGNDDSNQNIDGNF